MSKICNKRTASARESAAPHHYQQSAPLARVTFSSVDPELHQLLVGAAKLGAMVLTAVQPGAGHPIVRIYVLSERGAAQVRGQRPVESLTSWLGREREIVSAALGGQRDVHCSFAVYFAADLVELLLDADRRSGPKRFDYVVTMAPPGTRLDAAAFVKADEAPADVRARPESLVTHPSYSV